VWKALHMLVYVAYGLIVLHVAFSVFALFIAVGTLIQWAAAGG
jgi:DMSO/TMAO reductase YedYZ heme-binding membrane subunit